MQKTVSLLFPKKGELSPFEEDEQHNFFIYSYGLSYLDSEEEFDLNKREVWEDALDTIPMGHRALLVHYRLALYEKKKAIFTSPPLQLAHIKQLPSPKFSVFQASLNAETPLDLSVREGMIHQWTDKKEAEGIAKKYAKDNTRTMLAQLIYIMDWH